MTRGEDTVDPGPDVLHNLGPTSRERLASIGIVTARQLLDADPFEVYARLKAAHPGTSLNMLYALIGAVEGRHWQQVRRTDRTSILLRLDDMGLAPRRR